MVLALACGVVAIAVGAFATWRAGPPESDAAAAIATAVSASPADWDALVSGESSEPPPAEDELSVGVPEQLPDSKEPDASEPRAERIPAGPALRGVVVEAGTGAAVAGVLLELAFVGAVRGRAISDASGAFALAADPAGGGSVRASKDGWEFEPERVRVRHREPGELRFVGTPRASAPVRGRIVDMRAGDPVPFYELEVVARDRKAELVVSDLDGRFATRTPFPAGDVQLDFDPRGEWHEFEVKTSLEARGHRVVDGAAEPILLVLDVGPTYLFDLEPPPDSEVEHAWTTFANVGADARRALGAYPEAWRVDSVSTFWSNHSGGLLHAAVRSNAATWWARFPRALPESMRSRPAEAGYELFVAVGDVGGFALVPSAIGFQPTPVKVELSPLANIHVTAAGARDPPRLEAWAVLSAPGRPVLQVHGLGTEGHSYFSAVPPGAYSIEVTGPGAAGGPVSVHVDGVDLEVEVPTRRLEHMTVGGRLRTSARVLRREVMLELRSSTDSAQVYREVVDLSDAGELGAPFRFEVPDGAYVLSVLASGFAWEPAQVEVSSSRDDLELLCRDDVACATLTVEVVDAEDGASPRGAWWLVFVAEDSYPLRPDSQLTVPAGTSLHWFAGAPGHAAREGVFRIEPGASAASLRAALPRGAGMLVGALDPAGNGIPGAEILVDGRVVARTDERGFALLECPDRVQSIEARREGWICLPDQERSKALFGARQLRKPIYLVPKP
jgi:hypothetical protein